MIQNNIQVVTSFFFPEVSHAADRISCTNGQLDLLTTATRSCVEALLCLRGGGGRKFFAAYSTQLWGSGRLRRQSS